MKLPPAGLYRTRDALPGREAAIPAGVLVYVGRRPSDDGGFVVRPHDNRHNRWYWHEPTTPLAGEADAAWAATLMALPVEGFYTLPEDLELEGGGRWLRNAIVQLGYNAAGRGILFVAELREGDAANALHFSERGVAISDELLARLVWAPILPVGPQSPPPRSRAGFN
jgi:hypothetical protein